MASALAMYDAWSIVNDKGSTYLIGNSLNEKYFYLEVVAISQLGNMDARNA